MKVYFDNAATTKLRKEVIEVMMEAMNSSYGNPSSSHSFGRTSRALIESSRKEIAKHLNVNAEEIVFTSCGTESNNSILRSAIDFLDVKTIITSKIEHYAILNVVDFLKTKKIRVEYVNIDDDEIEIISPDELNVATIAAPREEEEPVLSDEDEADSDVESSEEKTDAGEEDTSEQNEDKKED